MNTKNYILFDLDGTLTDPKVGITKSFQYALKHYGIEEPDLDKLEVVIGPPLRDSFMEFYGFTMEKAIEAESKYRERFSTIGLYENEIYEGIAQMLEKLVSQDMHLAIASSKPTVFVEKILEHFSIKQYFEHIIGSNFDGTRSNKAEVVDAAIAGFGQVAKENILMVGDRKFDVIGAHERGIECVGVVYGYGGEEELQQAGADYLVYTVAELEALLL
ncbi:HAD hydrolase-like protein [Anaerosporobacter faecicola]|uniref:HAD hydrolase-like protein n=1 Tax=Anaerosporobacter faecicola TaxID=2718714 RepID=UPI00143BD7CF|nr:HAD hydrolase-like protein [Anaerosporobacter faecicola]